MRVLQVLVALTAWAALTACGSTTDEAASDMRPPSVGPTATSDSAEAIPCSTRPVDEAGFAGLSEEGAAERAAEDGDTLRVVCREGIALMGTADARQDRVNAAIEDGVVTSTWRG